MLNKKIIFTLYFVLPLAINVTAEVPDQQVQNCMNPIIGSPQGVPLCCGLYEGYNVEACCNKFVSQQAKDAYAADQTNVPDPVAGCVADVARLIETNGQSIDFKAINKLALTWFTEELNLLESWLQNKLTSLIQNLFTSFQQTASYAAGDFLDQGKATFSDVQSGLTDLVTSAINTVSAPAGASALFTSAANSETSASSATSPDQGQTTVA